MSPEKNPIPKKSSWWWKKISPLIFVGKCPMKNLPELQCKKNLLVVEKINMPIFAEKSRPEKIFPQCGKISIIEKISHIILEKAPHTLKKSPRKVEKISQVVEKICPPFFYRNSPLPGKISLFMGRAVLIKMYDFHVLYHYKAFCVKLRGRNIEYLNLCCSKHFSMAVGKPLEIVVSTVITVAELVTFADRIVLWPSCMIPSLKCFTDSVLVFMTNGRFFSATRKIFPMGFFC